MIATQTQDIKEQISLNDRAWERQGFGNQEILEKFNPIVAGVTGK